MLLHKGQKSTYEGCYLWINNHKKTFDKHVQMKVNADIHLKVTFIKTTSWSRLDQNMY